MTGLEPLFLGEFSAIAAALFWAAASIAFADIGKQVGALNLNLVKGAAAILLMSATLAAGSYMNLQTVNLSSLADISPYGWLLLIISGIIGIALGDTAYFACLKRIGPQKGLMLESTSPLMAAVLALWLYAEYLSPVSWSGIAITTMGVILVVRLSTGAPSFKSSTAGIMYGILAALGQATGIVFSRMALDGENIEPLTGGLIRLCSGLAILSILVAMRQTFATPGANISLTLAIQTLYRKRLFVKLLIATFVGTYLAIWLQQLAVKFTTAGIAQALLSTCPLFGILFGLCQGYRQPPLVWLGLLCGIAGITLLFHG